MKVNCGVVKGETSGGTGAGGGTDLGLLLPRGVRMIGESWKPDLKAD